MLGVLLRAVSKYKFIGTPLWRLSNRKDLVWVELTFHKALRTKPYYKRRAESKRQPAPIPASRLAHEEPTLTEREMLPPSTQILHLTSQQIIRPHYKNTVTITTSLTITGPARAPVSPEPLPPKMARTKSPVLENCHLSTVPTTTEKNTPCRRNMTSLKQSATSYMVRDVPIIKAQRIPREDD